MAKPDDAADFMPAAELKPLLNRSKRKPVSCAVGMTKEKQGIVLLHRRTKPRKLLAELRRQAASSSTILDHTTLRFGRAAVDGGSDSQTVRFTLNKAAPGPLRIKLLERLRPAGFQRCELAVDEALETETDADEPDDDEHDDPEPDDTSPVTPRPPSRPQPPPGPGNPLPSDPKTVRSGLLALARQIGPATADDPARQQELVQLATNARDSLKAGDLQAAATHVAALRKALPGEPPRAGADANPFGADLAAREGDDALVTKAAFHPPAPGPTSRSPLVQPVQMVIPAPALTPPPAVAGVGAPAPGSSLERDLAAASSRAGRRERYIGREVMDGRVGEALGQMFLGRPFPPDVDDPWSVTTPLPPNGDGGPASSDPPPTSLPDAPARLAPMPMTGLDPTHTTARPSPAPPPLITPPEGFDIDPDAGRPTVVSTPPPVPALTPNHTGSPPPAVNLGDLQEGFSTQAPQGPTVLESRVLPTPRTGPLGGKPTGTPTDESKGDPGTRRGHKRENEAARVFAALGYDYEQNPARSSGDAHDEGAEPDSRMGGNIFDVYSPKSDKMTTIREEMEGKVKQKQADRLILNLKDTHKTSRDIARMLKTDPIKGLKELFAMDQDGEVTRLFPEPGPIGRMR